MADVRNVLVLLAVLISMGLGCSGVEETGDRGVAVKGIVTDSTTSVPIEGAEIFVDDTLLAVPRYVTDSSGRYVISGLGYADWTIYCRANGYTTKSRHVRGEGSIEGIDFEM